MMQTLRELEHAFSALEQFKRRRKLPYSVRRAPVDHPPTASLVTW
jgi:hypothetical protein